MNTSQFPLDYCPMRSRTVIGQTGAVRLVLFNSQTEAYYGLDEVGAMVWGLCDGAHTLSEILNRLLGEYDASLEVIQMDLMELVQEMSEKKLLLTRAA